jgi:hypothetical protein
VDTHWDTKCLTCGHRKGSHLILTSVPVFDGRSVSRNTHTVDGIGHCCVDRREFGEATCTCTGFSDGKLWKDGKRMFIPPKMTSVCEGELQ